MPQTADNLIKTQQFCVHFSYVPLFPSFISLTKSDKIMDEVYACGYCEKEFSLVEELSAHEDACDQSGLLVDSDSEDEGSSTQKQEEPLAVSNMMDLCKTVFEEDTDEDDPSAVDKINTSMEDGCNRCGKIGFSNKKTKDVHEKICSGLFVRQPKFKAWKSNGVYNCKEPGCTEKTSFQSEYGWDIFIERNHFPKTCLFSLSLQPSDSLL